MQKLVKTLSAVLVLIIVASVCLGARAAGSNVISAETITARAGEELQIPISISENTGIMGFALIITYDPDVFTPLGVEKGAAFSGLLNDSIGADTDGSFKVVYTGTGSCNADGVVCTLKFRTSPQAQGSGIISVSYVQEDTFDEEYRDVVLSCGSINVDFSAEAASDETTTDEVETTEKEPEETTKPPEQTDSLWTRIVNFILSVIRTISAVFTDGR